MTVAVFSADGVLHPFDEAARYRLDSLIDLGSMVAPSHIPDAGPADGAGMPGPEVRALLTPMCEAFDVPEPELRLVPGDEPEARTFLLTRHTVTVSRGLLDQLPPDEIEAVLAREVGHIALGHVAYRSLLDAPAAPVPGAVRGALAAWARASELSADRAAAAYQGGADAVTRVLFRLAAATSSGPAARAYAVRVREIQAWTATPAFARLVAARTSPPRVTLA